MTPFVARVLRLVRAVIIGVFATMILVTFAQVIFRYVFRSPLPWSEELARYCFVWIVFLGATLGLERGVHIGVDILTILLPQRLQHLLLRFNQLLILGFALFIVVASLAVLEANQLQYSPALGLQMAKVYLAIPLGMLVMGLIVLGKLFPGRHSDTTLGR
jgi:TRAP-type transport system small permease protein